MRLRLVCRRSRIQPSGPAKRSFVEIKHSFPAAGCQLLAKGCALVQGLSLPRKNVVGLTDRLDITIVVCLGDWDVNPAPRPPPNKLYIQALFYFAGVIRIYLIYLHVYVLSTDPVLCRMAVDRGLRLST